MNSILLVFHLVKSDSGFCVCDELGNMGGTCNLNIIVIH